MKDTQNGICVVCGREFVKTRPDRKYCSRECSQYRANRAFKARRKEAIAQAGTGCPYNSELICDNRKCGTCGWNPQVAQRRMAALAAAGG